MDVADVTNKHSLVSLPSLYGLNNKLDLKGRDINKVIQEVEDIKKEKPLINMTLVEDADKLQSYAKEVDLFRVTFEPEVVANSMFPWFKTGDEQYSLLLPNNSWARLECDILGKWNISGQVLDQKIFEREPTFEQAIRRADAFITEYGGKHALLLGSREAKWKKRKDPPTEAQLSILRRFRILVPPDSTKGEISTRISKLLAELAAKRMARMALMHDKR